MRAIGLSLTCDFSYNHRQFSLYVHKGGLKPDSFHFISFHRQGGVAISAKSREGLYF